MTVIAVGSWRGSGATTASMLLAAGAAALGEQAWLVEADPAGGVLQGRSPLLEGVRCGLSDVAMGRHDETPRVALESSARSIGGVSVIPGIADSYAAWASVASPRVAWIDQLRRLSGVVVCDIGSLRGGPVPSWKVCEVADIVVMCATADAVSVVSTLGWIEAKGQSAPGVPGLAIDNARLLVIDSPAASGERFRADGLRAEIGDRMIGWWPWEPRLVDAVLRGGTLDHRSLRRLTLTRSVLASTAAVLEAVR